MSIYIDVEKTTYNDTVICKPHVVFVVSHGLKCATKSHFIFAFMRNLHAEYWLYAIKGAISVP